MSDKAKNPWRDRLDRMKKYQEAHCKSWKTNSDLLFGKTDDEDTPNRCAYGWGLCQSLITQIYIQNPDCILEAYKDKDDMQADIARLLSYVVPYDWDEMNLKFLGNLGILDNFVNGYAAFIETVETDKQAHRVEGEVVTKEHKPKGKKEKEPEEEVEEEATEQNYMTRRINPWDILFDPQGTLLDLSDHRYLAIAYYPTVADVKNDEIFSENLPDDIEEFPEVSTYTRREKRQSVAKGKTNADETDPDFRQICVWEIHDKINNEVIYMTDHKHHELGRIKPPYQLKIRNRKFFPVTIMAFFPSQSGFYPTPVIDLIASQLVTLNKLDARIYTDALTKWRKFVTWDDALDQDQKDKITDPGPANALMSVSQDLISVLAGEGQTHAIPDIHDIVAPLADPAPNQDVIMVREMCINEIQEVLGFGAASRGGMPKTRSAREAMAIKEKMDQRLHILTDAINTFYEWHGQKHILLLQQTMVVDRYAKVFTDEIQKLEQWKKYTADDIKGEFHFKVLTGTSMPRNTDSKRQSELMLFQAIAPILQQGGYPIEPAFLRLADAYQWKGVEQFFKNYKQVAKQAAMLIDTIGKGKQVPPNALPEALAALVRATLSDGELQMVKQQIETGMAGGGGSAPAQKGQRGDPTPNKTAAGQI